MIESIPPTNNQLPPHPGQDQISAEAMPVPGRFGLPQEENLSVLRSSGEMDSGWYVANRKDITAPDGEAIDSVVLNKVESGPNGEARVLSKLVRTSDLLSWQPQPEVPEASEEPPRQAAETAAPEQKWWERGAISPYEVPGRGIVGLAGRSALIGKEDNEMLKFIQGVFEEPPRMPLPSESPRNPRLEEIFAPRVAAETAPQPKDDDENEYDFLFEKDDAIYEQKRLALIAKDAAADEQKGRLPKVTEQSRDESALKIGEARSWDHKIDDIFAQHAEKFGRKDRWELADELRTNADLRYDLGSYFLDKIEEKWRNMPDRVRRNTQKNPNHSTYAHLNGLRSREYAALIALSMLDGTFHEPKHDPIDYDKHGEATLGQHRAAALELLH